MRRWIPLVVVAWIGGALAGDDARYRLEPRDALLWEELADGAEWLDGPAPTRRDGRSTVTLAPGESLRVRIEPGSAVRASAASPLEPGALAFSAGAGDGLLLGLLPVAAQGGGLAVFPRASRPNVLRVGRPATAPGPLEFSLQVLRRVPPRYPEWYTRPLTLPLPRVTVTAERPGERIDFHRLGLGEEVALEVDGPLRVMIEHHAHLPPVLGLLETTYRVDVETPGGAVTRRTYPLRPARRSHPRVDGVPAALGRAARSYVEIPAGRHRLALRADVALLVRVVAWPYDDYLLPGLNRPRGLDTALAPCGEGCDAAVLPSRVAEESRRLASQTAHRPAGLAAYWFTGGPVSADGHGEAGAAIRAGHLFYRDLEPAGAVAASSLARFYPRRLLRTGERRTTALVARAGDQPFDGLAGGRFHRLAATTTLDYRIPARDADSTLRLVFDLGHRPGRTELLLRIDDAEPLTVTYDPRDALPATALQLEPEGLAVGLARLRADPRGLAEPVVPVAVVDLPLPAEAGRVAVVHRDGDEAGIALQYLAATARLPEDGALLALVDAWAPGPIHERFAAYVAGRRDCHLQVGAFASRGNAERLAAQLAARGWPADTDTQARVGDVHLQRVRIGPFGSEEAWRQARETLAREGLAAWPVACAATGSGATADLPPEPLQLAWEPLRRWLHAAHRRFAGAGRESVLPEDPPLAATARARIEAAGSRAAVGGDRAGLVEARAALARGSRGAARLDATLALADALADAGEEYLAEQLVRGLLATGPPASGRAWAWLDGFYRDRGREDQRVALAAYRAVDEPGAETLRDLVTRLVETGDDDRALNLGVLLPVSARPTGALLEAALRAGWQTLATRLAAALAAPEAHLWHGRLAEANGALEEAEKAYREAGVLGADALARLAASRAVGAALADPNPETRRAAVEAWADLHSEADGPWRSAAEALRAHGGAVFLEQPELGSLLRRHRADPDVPLTLELAGPVALRIEARPLHPGEGDAALDDWLLVNGESGGVGWERRVPLLGNRPTSELQLADGGGGQPGQRVIAELALPRGFHRLQLQPRSRTVLLGIERRTPRVPSGVLPAISQTAVRAALAGQLVANGSGGEWLRGALLTDTGLAEGLHLDASAHAADAADRWPGHPPAEPDETEAERLDLLWRATTVGVDEALLIRAERLATAQPRLRPDLGPVLSHGRWQPVDQVEGGLGLYRVETPGYVPESPGARIRAALHEAVPRDARRVMPGSVGGLEYFTPVAADLAVELTLRSPPFLDDLPLAVRLRVDGGPWREITLRGGAAHAEVVALAPGRHRIEVGMADHHANQSLFVRFPGAGEEMLSTWRQYRVADANAPLRVPLEGPALLRIESLGAPSRMLEVPGGRATVPVAPEAGQDEAYLRLFRLRADPRDPEEGAAPRPRPLPPPGEPLPWGPRPAHAGPLEHDGIAQQPREIATGTWSSALAWVERRAGDDDESGDRDEFLEANAIYRERDEAVPAWWRVGALYRLREAHDTLGLRWAWLGETEVSRLEGEPWPLTTEFALDWYGQETDEDLAWSLTARARASRRLDLGPRLFHLPSAGLFARALGDAEGRGRAVDLDVWSDYKRDHRHGLRLADVLVGRPWQDAEWRLGGSIDSNESLLDIDRATLRLEWRQLLGPGQVDLALRRRHAFEDADRSSDRESTRFDLNLSWEKRLTGGRLVLSAGWQRALELDESAFRLELAWHRERGLAYDDFRPGEFDFVPLRRAIHGAADVP